MRVAVKEEYKDKIKLLIVTQPLEGWWIKKPRLYEAITAKADIAGGLPSKIVPTMNNT